MTERTDLRLVEGETVGHPAVTGNATDPHGARAGDPVPISPDPVFEMVAEIFERGNLLLEETVRRISGLMD